MGTIYRNGVPFVGSGGAGGVEMTMAEYELLPESEKMNGAIYFITDGDVSYPSASQMRYDNTESQIPSTTVQGAIDENRIEINGLKSGLIYNYGTQVNIIGYNSSSNMWTAPKDGFVFAQVWNSDSTLDVWFGGDIFAVNLKNSTAGYCRSYATFVKKGMTMWFGGSGSNRSCYFAPLNTN